MAIAHEASTGSPAGFAQGSTSISVAYVGTPSAGDLGVLVACVKPETATWNTVSGWTLAAQATGGTGTSGVDTGPTRVGVWVRELDGSESGSVTITNSGGNSSAGAMSLYTKDAGNTWDTSVTVTGDDASHDSGTDAHGTTGGSWTLAANDWVLVAHALDTDTAMGSSGPTLTQTSATFGAVTLRNASRSGTNNDCAAMSWDASVSGGSTNAPTFSWTGSTADCGPYAFLRLREVAGGAGQAPAGLASGTGAAYNATVATSGGAGAPAGQAAPGRFNGVLWPKIVVLASFGGTLDEGAQYIHLGTGPGLGTGLLGGFAETDISADVRAVSWSRGRQSEVDTAEPGRGQILLGNHHGYYDPTNGASPYGIDIGTPVKVRAELDGVAYPRITGFVSDIQCDFGLDPTALVTVTDGLEVLGRAQLSVSAATMDGDTTGERIGHLADQAAWPTALRALDTGYTTLGPTTLGDGALELARKTEQTEFGLLYVDATGTLTFYDRHRTETATRSTVVQAALTDTGGAGELGMSALQLELSREGAYNDAHITREPAPATPSQLGEEIPQDEPVEQVATDAASVAQYGTLSFPGSVGLLLRSDAEALAFAQYLIDRFANPQPRIREVVVNALRGDLWTVLLPLTLLDRISVRRDYGPATFTTALLVQGVAEEIRPSPATWTLTFTTTPPPPAASLFVLGTSQLGSGVLGW